MKNLFSYTLKMKSISVKLFSLIFSIVLFLHTIPLNIAYAYIPEYGDSFSTAEDLDVIEIRCSVLGELEDEDDYDYFYFVAGVTGEYQIYTTGTTDTYGTLYEERTRMTRNDDGGDRTNFWITVDLEAGTTYYIRVECGDPDELGEYIMFIEAPEDVDDYGNTRSEAYKFGTINSNVKASGSLEKKGDKDYFRFKVSESGDYLIYTTGSTDTYGELYRSSTCIEKNDDSGDGHNFEFAVELEEGTTYYVCVKGYGDSTTGLYTLNIIVPEPKDDYGNNVFDAKKLGHVGQDTTISGRIEAKYDVDFFEFYPDIAGKYEIYTTGRLDTMGLLCRENVQKVENDDSDSGVNFRIVYDLEEDIKYQIKVSACGRLTGDYVLHIRCMEEYIIPDDPIPENTLPT